MGPEVENFFESRWKLRVPIQHNYLSGTVRERVPVIWGPRPEKARGGGGGGTRVQRGALIWWGKKGFRKIDGGGKGGRGGRKNEWFV